ncbi:hypothetical protein B0H17DRAFT_1205545 [Mycena rosella]|uniref:Retrovirus-related Pol polyprotein from transposon TNT 1-94-like beta-barrel domain-containing protein n=1 Tax=Mycena rosella TaxID=1033263 RepID=A0AAD7DAA7_MYCRO|nr:hypothetical protein B0H17DRAFT_1205545 [Mycena rosella]
MDVDDNHPKVLLTKTTNALCSDVLFVNSGVSHHLTSDCSSFITYTTLNNPIPIQLGDNGQIFTVGCGTSRTRIKTPSGIQKMDFTCTLYAPKLTGSLLSVGQLTHSFLIHAQGQNTCTGCFALGSIAPVWYFSGFIFISRSTRECLVYEIDLVIQSQPPSLSFHAADGVLHVLDRAVSLLA